MSDYKSILKLDKSVLVDVLGFTQEEADYYDAVIGKVNKELYEVYGDYDTDIYLVKDEKESIYMDYEMRSEFLKLNYVIEEENYEKMD